MVSIQNMDLSRKVQNLSDSFSCTFPCVVLVIFFQKMAFTKKFIAMVVTFLMTLWYYLDWEFLGNWLHHGWNIKLTAKSILVFAAIENSGCFGSRAQFASLSSGQLRENIAQHQC